MSDPSAITWWMAILTILVGLQTVALAFIAIKGIAFFNRAESTLGAVDRAIEPITEGTKELLGDLHALSQTAQRAERGVSSAIDRVSSATDLLKLAAVRKFWPVFGTLAAGRAIFNTISARRRPSRRVREAEDEAAEAQFVSEGGPIHELR